MDQQNLGIDGTGIQAPEKPAWIAQFPDDLKGNETFTSYKTLGDFGKAHLEVLGKVKELDGITAKTKELEGKLSNSIPKLSDKATPEEISAYHKAMGVPDKPEGYEFPQIGDVENSPEMVAWAQKTFHSAKLSKEQGSFVQREWSSFVAGIVEAENKMAEDEKIANEKKFRDEFKSEEEYKAGMELSKRFWKKITNTEFDEAYKEAEAWQVPAFMRFIFVVAKATGEDISPPGSGGGQEGTPQMIYDKTPGMGKNK